MLKKIFLTFFLALPACAAPEELGPIAAARRALAAHERAEPMLQAGLWRHGADPEADRAVAIFPALDAFCATASPDGPAGALARLTVALGEGPEGLAAAAS